MRQIDPKRELQQTCLSKVITKASYIAQELDLGQLHPATLTTVPLTTPGHLASQNSYLQYCSKPTENCVITTACLEIFVEHGGF